MMMMPYQKPSMNEMAKFIKKQKEKDDDSEGEVAV